MTPRPPSLDLGPGFRVEPAQPRDAAVELIRRSLPPDLLAAFRAVFAIDAAAELPPLVGTGVKDLLRENGFDAARLGVDDLDEIWTELVARAVRDDA